MATLYERLFDCTVKVEANGPQGTGFFVAPDLVLTCAHVVERAQNVGKAASIQVLWKGQSYPASISASSATDFPDLALLSVAIPNHPCVLLAGSAEPRDELYTFGYPASEPNGASTTFSSEGWLGQNYDVLRLKEGQVSSGMSGSPVLNEKIGSICGIIEATRDPRSTLGGEAVLTRVIFRQFPELVEEQKRFHMRDKGWSDILTQQQREMLQLGWLPAPTITGKIQVFYSYSHKDEELRDDLETALVLMRRQKLIEGWYDRNIDAGEELEGEIAEHLEKAHIILLLVSPAFMRSDYCYEKEMMYAMARHEARTARVIPIILRPCEWQSAPFGKLKALPKDGKPITTWSNRDEAFLDVARGIRRVVEELTKST